MVEQKKCDGLAHLIECLKQVEAGGGEGYVRFLFTRGRSSLILIRVSRLMLREPGSLYVNKRSGTLLKVKTFFDAEAKVVGYEPGKVSFVWRGLGCELMRDGRASTSG